MVSSLDHIVVFARAPRLGQVKTRLASEIGPERALEIYRSMTEHVLAVVHPVGARIIVAHAPADAGPEMRAWLGANVTYEPQADGDLGERMASVFERRIADRADRVVIVGSDCPTVTVETITSALDALDGADVVFGPALDGGYYLVAARRLHRALFRDVPWSSARTLDVSLIRAREAGQRVALLTPMRDIDTADDWRAYGERLPPHP